MRPIFYLVLSVALTLCVSPFGLADVEIPSPTSSDIAGDTYPHISALENAILGYSFPKQPLPERLERMEKKAFGKASTNPDLSARTDALDDYTDTQLHKKLLQANVDDATNPGEEQPVQDQPEYPHITTLEQTILGQTFAGQPLANRISRMEIKAFGQASNSPDLSERTDALDDYADKRLHKKVVQENPDQEEISSMTDSQSGTYTQSSTDTSSSQSPGDYPHITSLEQAILGQTYVGQPLADRISRMEVKAFGQASTNPDLSDRTDRLEAYAEKKLHKPPSTNQETDTAGNPNSQGGGGGLLSKVGQTLLGMSGIGGPAIGGMGMPGFGMGGMGMNGMGMGGGGMRRRQAQQQQDTPPAPVKQEDPAVYQATAPDVNARLIVKTGWCEVQLFGHTFPSMHLPERLGQINKELKLEPGKSDVQLMDDIGLMIKTVQARKPATTQIGQSKASSL